MSAATLLGTIWSIVTFRALYGATEKNEKKNGSFCQSID
jgi:hypothetical protein